MIPLTACPHEGVLTVSITGRFDWRFSLVAVSFSSTVLHKVTSKISMLVNKCGNLFLFKGLLLARSVHFCSYVRSSQDIERFFYPHGRCMGGYKRCHTTSLLVEAAVFGELGRRLESLENTPFSRLSLLVMSCLVIILCGMRRSSDASGSFFEAGAVL